MTKEDKKALRLKFREQKNASQDTGKTVPPAQDFTEFNKRLDELNKSYEEDLKPVTNTPPPAITNTKTTPEITITKTEQKETKWSEIPDHNKQLEAFHSLLTEHASKFSPDKFMDTAVTFQKVNPDIPVEKLSKMLIKIPNLQRILPIKTRDKKPLPLSGYPKFLNNYIPEQVAKLKALEDLQKSLISENYVGKPLEFLGAIAEFKALHTNIHTYQIAEKALTTPDVNKLLKLPDKDSTINPMRFIVDFLANIKDKDPTNKIHIANARLEALKAQKQQNTSSESTNSGSNAYESSEIVHQENLDFSTATVLFTNSPHKQTFLDIVQTTTDLENLGVEVQHRLYFKNDELKKFLNGTHKGCEDVLKTLNMLKENIGQYQEPITQGQIDQFYLDFGSREGRPVCVELTRPVSELRGEPGVFALVTTAYSTEQLKVSAYKWPGESTIKPDELIHADLHGAVVIPDAVLPKLGEAIESLLSTLRRQPRRQ